MSKKNLIFNQEGKEPQYLYYPNGNKKAVLVHILGSGDCPRCYEELENHHSDGIRIYKKIVFLVWF